MNIKQQIKEILFKKRRIYINNWFIELEVKYVLAMPIRIMLMILVGILSGVLIAQIMYT